MTLVATTNALVVVRVAPNLIRQASLQIPSSNLHYFGDVDGVMKEAQVFNKWFFLPLQRFTFNYGSTHVIHYFVVNQPFYVRQMVAGAAHRTMKGDGIRSIAATNLRLRTMLPRGVRANRDIMSKSNIRMPGCEFSNPR